MSEINTHAWSAVAPPADQTTAGSDDPGDPGNAARKTDRHALARHCAGIFTLMRTRR